MTYSTIEVALGDRSYPIYAGSDMLSTFAPTCDRHGIPRRVTLVTDANVGRRYLKALEDHLRHFGFDPCSVVVPPGERQKSLARANALYTTMLDNGVGRKSAVIALGGGVIGDLAGFVAATYHRGVKVVQVPTTLLAQVDSSIGGKVAVNHPLGKNMIGAFHQPAFVWVDMTYLGSLPVREVVCGLGEVVKYGVIKDPELFQYLEQNIEKVVALDRDALVFVQAHCSGIKARLVSEDEREHGPRVMLNFGHTVGHALESAGGYRLLKHGEAVLLGMVAESFIARETGMLSSAEFDRIVALIRRVPVKAGLKALKPSTIVRAMARDKKAHAGTTRFVLPTRIGEVRVVDAIEPAVVESSLKLILRGSA